MNSKVRNILILIGIVIILFLLKGWWTKKLIVALGGYVNKEVKTVTVKEYIKGEIDSSAVFIDWVKTKDIILNPKAKIVYKEKKDTSTGETIIDSTKVFNVGINDKYIDGKFKVENAFNGDLLTTEFDYKFKELPLAVRVDTLRITNIVTEILDNKRGYIGTGIGYNNLDYVSALLGYTTKNNWQFLVEYGKPTTDIKEVIDGVPFKVKRDDMFGIKIIKNW